MLDLARANPERERAERPVGGRVRVAADERDARDRQPLLRADDVHDAATGIADTEVENAPLGGVTPERLDHVPGLGVGRR